MSDNRRGINLMILPLRPPYPVTVQPVFQELDYHLAIRTVLSGDMEGVVLVDDPHRPKAAMVQAGHRCHLAGEVSQQFVQTLRAYFFEKLLPEGETAGGGFTLYYQLDWEEVIESQILPGAYPLKSIHNYYEHRSLGEAQAAEPLEGFDMIPVDRQLIQQTHLENLEYLKEEMQSERDSVEAFLANSFGSALIHASRLVSWCLSEYNHSKRCEVGIWTDRSYRRQGLGTAAGLAFLQQAREAGLERIGWHCYRDNIPSGKTAERLGYQKIQDYPALLTLPKLSEQLALHGDRAMDRKQYAQALEWFERAFAEGDGPAWAYYLAGCAHAMLGNHPAAIERLEQAVERGFRKRSVFESSPWLEVLRKDASWSQLNDLLE
jgi:RimJ/RimL family protein N-acetyltransferase